MRTRPEHLSTFAVYAHPDGLLARFYDTRGEARSEITARHVEDLAAAIAIHLQDFRPKERAA